MLDEQPKASIYDEVVYRKVQIKELLSFTPKNYRETIAEIN